MQVPFKIVGTLTLSFTYFSPPCSSKVVCINTVCNVSEGSMHELGNEQQEECRHNMKCLVETAEARIHLDKFEEE